MTGIKRKAKQLGYLGCRIIPSIIFNEYIQNLDERSELFPQSKELYEPLYKLATPPENAKSIIVCTQRYNKYKLPQGLKGLIGKCFLFDSRVPYSNEFRVKAEFEEYLKIIGINILQRSVPYRLAAAKAGLGKFARNNFIYNEEYGSYIWIDVFVVDKKLDYDPLEENLLLDACNDNCGKCIRSCPTKALQGNFLMDRRKCITQLLTHPRDTLDDDTRTQTGLWIYGCDVCQDVCPLNKGKFTEEEEFPLLWEFEEYLKPQNILEMDNDTYLKIINPRFWYAGKDGLWRWKCLTLHSMVNSCEEKYHSLIRTYCHHEDQRISKTAQFCYKSVCCKSGGI